MTLRTIHTTGGKLVEAVKDLYCLDCRGNGQIIRMALDHDSWTYMPDRFETCKTCNGTGI